MPVPSIAFDLTRLITRLRHASPSGIDRVDLAYARHVLGQTGARFGVVSTALGPKVLERDEARAIVEAVAAGWIEDRAAEEDPVYRHLAASLGSPVRDIPGRDASAPASRRQAAAARRRLQLRTAATVLRARSSDRLPRGTVYLHTSHLRLDRPERFDWLYGRRDIRPVFFVHDLIPIAYPEYGRPGEAERHAVRMGTIAAHADHVVVNSADVAAHFSGYLGARGLPAKPTTVAWLGVEPVFQRGSGAPGLVPDRPTFVTCGTIEPRKNHLGLLNLWRDLAQSHGPATPRLVLVGRRGWEAENIVDMLERCPAVRAHVIEVGGLSSHGLARLLQGATALLMPSFAEGYGLPVVEAAACGLPVVASDIAVHREIGGGFAHLLDPLDGSGWREAVEALSAANSSLGADLRHSLDGYAPPDWTAHFAIVDALLADRVAALPPRA
jgi:glycosyltransferase involved in cell wall biosynthesis